MTGDRTERLLDEAEKRFASEAKLISLETGTAVFVGDTHGDLNATEKVVHKYLKPKHRLVFLGDYVDRGPASQRNINFLLEQKIEHPDSLYLLMGNHEGHALSSFHPADFWEGLGDRLRLRYGEVLAGLPLAASSSNGIIALHGALPDVPALDDINGIVPGSAEWQQITWGDWQEGAGEFLGADPYGGRLSFGQGWFERLMSRFSKNVLVRSHQPDAPSVMYGGRCLTIFTSSAYRHYRSEPAVAVVDLEREVNSADDIRIETI
ncbi:MAG: serine/threonine protein phosphatase [Dehalococcoidia bacterium]|nr:serine/threonine protein phosphatase [Dehalococcoidia bacterium]